MDFYRAVPISGVPSNDQGVKEEWIRPLIAADIDFTG